MVTLNTFASRLASLALLLVLPCACTDTNGLLLRTPQASDVGLDAPTQDVTADAPGKDDEAFCLQQGPSRLPDGTCSADLARETFQQALCLCDDLSQSGALTTRRLGQRPASVGVNGSFDSDRVDVDGTLIAASPLGLTLNQDLSAENLSVGGRLVAETNVSVVGDAAINGDVTIQGDLEVGGTLFIPPERNLDVNGATRVNAREDGPVDLDLPCPCTPGTTGTIAQWIDEASTNNDNDTINLTADALSGPNLQQLELPCGRYFLDAISTSQAVEIVVTGRVALFIAGRLSLEETLTLTLAEGAELDLFVGGAITAPKRVALGDPAHPDALRIYAATSSTLSLAGNFELDGFLYAPAAELVLSAGARIRGGAVLRRISVSGPLEIDYDDSLSAQRCPP